MEQFSSVVDAGRWPKTLVDDDVSFFVVESNCFELQSIPMIQIRTLLLMAALLAVVPSQAMACPTCKSALHSGLALGYAISILFMMAMPFLIFAFWAFIILRLRCNATEESFDPAIDPQTNS